MDEKDLKKFLTIDISSNILMAVSWWLSLRFGDAMTPSEQLGFGLLAAASSMASIFCFFGRIIWRSELEG